MNKYSPDLSSQFKDKVVIITGSTQGSGAETAKLMANRGAKGITICGRKEKEGLEIDAEGCLSIPDLAVDVPRQTKIKVTYSDEEMNKKNIVAEGYFARVLQHEIDHLDGILIIDRGVENGFFYKGEQVSKNEVDQKFLI